MKTLTRLLPATLATLSCAKGPTTSQPTKFSADALNESDLPMMPEFRGYPPLPNPWQAKWFRLANSHPSLLRACDAVQAFGFDWFQHKQARNLVLWGDVGCGKTVLAERLGVWAGAVRFTSWERAHWPSPPSTGFIRWQDIADRLEAGKTSMEETLSDACAETLLVVDDIGSDSDRFKSHKATDALAYLLTRRQGRGFTVLTTNIAPPVWKIRWDARVEDRLLRNSTVVDMSECPSWAKL